MAVKVSIINPEINISNPECVAASDLKTILEKSFSNTNAKGNVYIAYGLTLSGQSVRDVDLLMFGHLDNYTLNKYYTNDVHYSKKDLKVDSFCIAIELKEHTSDRVSKNTTHILVNYKGRWKDATEQNEKQRYALSSYLQNEMGSSPYVTNILWLKSLTSDQLRSIAGNNELGALPMNFSFKDIVRVIIAQGMIPYYDHTDKCYHLNSDMDSEYVNLVIRTLFTSKTPCSSLTRSKLEKIIQQKITAQNNLKEIGEKQVVFKGRAGTGKTFRLIQTALQLANEVTGSRCLLLTYNHALVSDIRRLLHFMDIPDGIDTYTVQIQTLHEFFMQMMKMLDIDISKIYGARFDAEYEKALSELLEYVKSVMDEKDIATLKNDNEFAIDWDYVLIDEGQDWLPEEKDILFKVYGSDSIIVADGVDQFMRNNKRLIWTSKNTLVKEQKQGLRQKANLINFVNAIANELGLKWNIASCRDDRYAGGKVYVCSNYTKSLHNELMDKCKKDGGDAYDMLFLIPYQMSPNIDKECEGIIKIDLEKWEKNGIILFDGTNARLRKQYSTNVDACRLYMYESCRGLEAWTTVCLNFDVLIENKFKEAKSIQFPESLELESEEDKQKKYVYLWSLMPLTRPIDTLVITLKNPDSEIGQVLKRIAEKNVNVYWNI